MLKQGEIYWITVNERTLNKKLKSYKHPIVCLEDTDETDKTKDMFHAVILSTKDTPHDSFITNELMPLKFFAKRNERNNYNVPTSDNQHLVKIGLLKHIKRMPPKPSGKISHTGICWIFNQLLKGDNIWHNIENYTIKEYVEMTNKQNNN
ncbi:MAG: hypothetical protein IJ169_04870 [Paludibacteraceae bacterium]|nr:hypothetical protein [Paludibacteraceae bacterium]